MTNEEWYAWQKQALREEFKENMDERKKQAKRRRGKAPNSQRLPQPGRRLPSDFHK